MFSKEAIGLLLKPMYLRVMKSKISNHDILRIIASIGSDDFFDQIADITSYSIPYEGMVIFLYGDNCSPIAKGCYKLACDYKAGLENFTKYTYVLNPVYRAFLDDVKASTYLIADLVPQDIDSQIARSTLNIRIDKREAIGYRTPGWPKNMTEVLGLVHLPGNKMIELNFLTSRNSDQVRKCRQGLEALYPVLASAILKHFEFAPQQFDISSPSPSQESRFQNFGKNVLTEREQGVVKLILTGHSSNSIALHLDISVPTVKTHRRNLYSKFNISSQAELFNLFVRHLMDNAA